MKKPLQLLILASAALSGVALADNVPQTTTVDKVLAAKGATTAEAQVKREVTTVISPRTGIRYTLGNTGGRPIILKTAAIAAVTPATVNRVVASNPALSVSSQEKVKQALLAADTTTAVQQ